MDNPAPIAQPAAHTRQNRHILQLASLIMLVGLFLCLGKQPLFLEEPRRTMVSMEMMENGNLIVPTQLGNYYYRKPPGFNWALIASAKLFGGFSEFSMRLVTVLSALLTGLLVFLVGRRYVNPTFGGLAALFFVGCGGILFYFSTLAEIDLFYSLITFASFLCLFHFFQQERWYLLFTSTYFLAAFGTLTKSIPSILFTGLSILAYFILKKAHKKLFHPAHFLGIGVYVLVVGGYLYAYEHFHELRYLLPNMLGDSTQRTLVSQGLMPLFSHLLQFPLNALVDLLPGSLLLLFAVQKDFFSKIKENELIFFATIVIAVNFPVYWISPGARQRYIYMLYPLALMVGIYFYQYHSTEKHYLNRVLKILAIVVLVILTLGGIVIYFIPDLAFLPYRLPLCIMTVLIGLALLYLQIKKPSPPLSMIILVLALFRILFDLAILPQRAHDSGAQKEKEIAEKIVEIADGRQLYLWKNSRISFTTVVYINLARDKTLRRHPGQEPNALYLAPKNLMVDPHRQLFEFTWHGEPFILFEFLE